MDDSLNNIDDSVDDPYEHELVNLWQELLTNFNDEERHQELLNLAQKFLLLDRLAQLYEAYLKQNPESGIAKKYQQKIFAVTTLTFLHRPAKIGTPARPYRGFAPFFLIFLLVGSIFSLHYSRQIQREFLEKNYQKGLHAMISGKFEDARMYFEKVKRIDDGYKDIDMRLELIKKSSGEQRSIKPIPTTTVTVTGVEPSEKQPAIDNKDH